MGFRSRNLQDSYGEAAVGLLTKAPEKKSTSLEMAMEALSRVTGQSSVQQVTPLRSAKNRRSV